VKKEGKSDVAEKRTGSKMKSKEKKGQ